MQIGVEMSKALENKRIFIVDDDEIIRAALQFMLHDDYEAHEVASVDAALAKAQTQAPDLIVLAEALVQAKGLEILPQLQAAAPRAKILVVVDTLDSGFGKTCVGAGAHGFLAKPLKIEFVRQKVDNMLGRGKVVTIPLAVLSTR